MLGSQRAGGELADPILKSFETRELTLNKTAVSPLLTPEKVNTVSSSVRSLFGNRLPSLGEKDGRPSISTLIDQAWNKTRSFKTWRSRRMRPTIKRNNHH